MDRVGFEPTTSAMPTVEDRIKACSNSTCSAFLANFSFPISLSAIQPNLLLSLSLSSPFVTIVLNIRNGRKIQEIHVSTNSMKDELVREVRAASTAKGNLEGHKAGLAEGRAEDRL